MSKILRFFVVSAVPLFFSFFGFSIAFAQFPGSNGSAPLNNPNDELRRLTGTALTVQVRDENGAAIGMLGVVTLANFGGQTLGAETTFSSRAVFSRLHEGLYSIYVDVPGYERIKVQTEIHDEHGEQTVTVTLHPDSSGGSPYATSKGAILSPKAQKQTVKAIEEVQSNKFDDAIKRLESAQHLAPTHPVIPYLLGTAYDKKNDAVSAMKYWNQAIQLDPKHVPSFLACGDSLLRRKDAEGARKYLDKAVDIAPNSWTAQSLLSEALLRQSDYVDAVMHAQRAIDLGKGRANSALLILGQALISEHQNEAGISALQSYLATNPQAANVKAVQDIIDHAKNSESTPSPANVGLGSVDLTDLPLNAELANWMPADVDDSDPPVDPGVACPLNDILEKVSANVKGISSLADRYTATETLRQENMTKAGYIKDEVKLSFNYLVSIAEFQGKYLDVEEYRNGSISSDVFPDQLASLGLSSIALIFHPYLISDFNIKCDGLSRVGNNFAWQIYFRQRDDKPSRVRAYRVNEKLVQIALKGRAWVDPNTFQIIRIETDLREPHRELQLKTEHLVVEYGPVRFKSKNEELWLPTSADYYAIIGDHRFHRRHSYADYVLFSVDDKQKIGEPPKPSAVADSSGGTRPLN